MKRQITAIVVTGLLLSACANPGMYNTQRGAAIGGGLGAVMGQAIGRNTESTLIGAGVGTLLGSVLGNYEDQRAAEAWRYQQSQPAATTAPRAAAPAYSGNYAAPEPQVIYVAPKPHRRSGPPGRWVTVPGRWTGGRWVPPHDQWRPVHPR